MLYAIRAAMAILLGYLILFSSCQTKTETSGREELEPVKELLLETITDTMNLEVEVIADQVEIILLEKTTEALIGGGVNSYAINPDFIVVESNKQMLLYDRDGSFKRILTRQGKGPGEYVYARLMQIFNNMLYYTDAGKPGSGLSGINLMTGAIRKLKLVKDNMRLSDYQLSDAGLTMVADSIRDERFIRILYQRTLEGELLNETFLGIRDVNNRAHLGPYNLITDQQSLYMINPQGDSVMQLGSSVSELAFQFILPDVPDDSRGHAQAIQLNVMSFNSNNLLAIKRTINIQPGRIRMSFPHYLFFDRMSGQGHFFEKIVIKEFDLELSPLSLVIEEPPVLCFEISAIDFIEKAQAALESQNLSNKNRKQLNELSSKLTEEDNPVLIMLHLSNK